LRWKNRLMNFSVRWQKCDLGTRVDERGRAGRFAAGTSVFSAGGVPGGRYAVASGVFLLWMLLNNLRLSTLDLRSMLCAVLLAGALVFGMMGYRTTGAQIFFVCNANCPKWEDELKRCELTSKCVLTVWPYPRWKFPWTVSPAAAAPN
jgi:hypothetical protein